AMLASICWAALAFQPFQAKYACATLLCMYGEVTGNGGGSSCRGPIRDYFKVIKTKHGIPHPGRTLSARKDFLNACGGSGTKSQATKVHSKFGKMLFRSEERRGGK